ncbi:N-6 DNA methylase [Microbacterium sp. NPDC056044]|uniref:type I restriction-modification system subunit M n=1 Tax=Microbacterium sp. NPDC056044 TaxID=3345690 RepID=UPI0035D88545
MALKKSDLYSSLWSSADELRGGMDASQYKDYVLTLLFVKYVSDKAKADPYSLITVPEGGSFDDLVKLKGKAEIGDFVNKAIYKLAEANDLVDVLKSADFDDKTKLGDGKELVDRVSNLIGIFQDLDFSGSKAEGDDLLGDAYEYLMRHFATESGKSKGQFYTPAEVSRVMAQLLEIPANTPKSTTVYDPTCGSGSLLIKVADASPNGLSIYGQENDVATWALARMNMILHGNDTATLERGNTLSKPMFKSSEKELQRFDYLVANPPFSVKTWTNGFDASFGRFDGYPEPPAKNGDYAFLLHMLKSLKATGRGAVILPHGVLFRGNTEGSIRERLIEHGYIKAIIGLPANLFYGTGIPAVILVLDKAGAKDRKGIYMVDASKGFAKDGPKNRLRPRDMHKLVDAYIKQAEIPGYSRFVPKDVIKSAKNAYNLNIPRYIDSSDPEDIQDLEGHIKGGIPNRDLDALQPYWDAFPSLRATLFRPLRDGYSELEIEQAAIPAAVTASAEYQGFTSGTADAVTEWWSGSRAALEAISKTTLPNDLIFDISERLLSVIRNRPLLDEYGVYEQLMSYWNDSMHDDVALIAAEGWEAASRPRPARTWKDKNGKTKYEDANLAFGTGTKAARWVMDLIPPELIVGRYFATEKQELDELVAAQEAASQAVAEFVEENAVEEGLLWDAADEDGKVSAALAKTRLRDARAEGATKDELDALGAVITLYNAEATAKRKVKDAVLKLDQVTLAQYAKLAQPDVRLLVIEDKWGKEVERRVQSEIAKLRHVFVTRLEELASRYAATVADLESEVDRLATAVATHLQGLGVSA